MRRKRDNSRAEKKQRRILSSSSFVLSTFDNTEAFFIQRGRDCIFPSDFLFIHRRRRRLHSIVIECNQHITIVCSSPFISFSFGKNTQVTLINVSYLFSPAFIHLISLLQRYVHRSSSHPPLSYSSFTTINTFKLHEREAVQWNDTESHFISRISLSGDFVHTLGFVRQ